MHAVMRLSIAIQDESTLRAYAEKQSGDSLGLDRPLNVAECVYEALIGSSEGPALLDIGLELIETECDVYENGEVIASGS